MDRVDDIVKTKEENHSRATKKQRSFDRERFQLGGKASFVARFSAGFLRQTARATRFTWEISIMSISRRRSVSATARKRKGNRIIAESICIATAVLLAMFCVEILTLLFAEKIYSSEVYTSKGTRIRMYL